MNTDNNQQMEDIYKNAIITHKIPLKMTQIGDKDKNNNTIEQAFKANYEGKCSQYGFVKTCKMIACTSGEFNTAGENEFTGTFQCSIFNPVIGMVLSGVVQSVNSKSGIVVHGGDQKTSPFIAFIPNDFSGASNLSKYKEGNKIKCKVIGSITHPNNKDDNKIYIMCELVK
jgi:DNA-directed RNA polymerase subunit E'/Rpb7